MDNESLKDSYFEGNLTPKEKMLFDKLMETDESFANAVAFEEKTRVAITLESRKQLKEKLRKLEAKPQQRTSRSWLYIAASAIVLLGVSLFFIDQTPSNDKLFATYFEPYPNTESPIVRSGSEKTSKDAAFAAYELGDYQQASELFYSLSETTQEEYAPFYNAISLMKLDNLKEASNILATTTWSTKYKGKAEWYLSLCHIKEHRLEEAKSILRIIVENDSYNSDKARKLLQKLE